MFEVDLAACELRKRGRTVKLQDQPFQVLAQLLRRPGEVVTREELQAALWPEGTYVEFDQSVNTAIKKIRQALGDSAENPRFIETLPRKGYRFIAPVSGASAADLVPAVVPNAGEESTRSRWRTRALFSSLAVLLGCAVLAATWWLVRSNAPARGTLSGYKMTQLTRDSGLTATPALSPDGKLVAYASDRAGPGNLDIWVQQVDGRSAVRLTDHEASDYSPAFSPDGSRVVFRSERDGGGLYIAPALGGEPRLLVRDGHLPRFSPDGSLIAYSVGTQGSFDGAKLYVIPSHGGPATQLHPEFQTAALPLWTPGGRRLVFIGVHREHGGDLWVTSLGSEPPVRTGVLPALKAQGLNLASLDGWIDDNYLLFTGSSGDSVNLWRLPIAPRTWQVKGRAERLTFGVSEASASVGPQGRVVFSSESQRISLWGLPIDANRGVVRGDLRLLVDSGGGDAAGDISVDGRKLVFRSGRTRAVEIWMKDLTTQKETALTDDPKIPKSMPKISHDGSRVAFTRFEQGKRVTYVTPAGGGVPQAVSDSCGGPSDWSWDGGKLIYHRTDEQRSRIHVLDLRTGQHRLLIEHPEHSLYVPRFAPNDRWIVFKADLDMQRTKIFVVPFRDGRVPPPAEWIAVTEGRSWDDHPRWSPGGNLIYFTSSRDGYRCIWARRLDARKHPSGDPFPIRHFHQIQLSMSTVSLASMELALARDKLVFPLAELKANVWMMVPDEKGGNQRSR